MNYLIVPKQKSTYTEPISDYEKLKHAIQYHSISQTRKILDENNQINEFPEDEKPFLHLAIEHGNLEIIKLLINYGANINLQDHQKQTALNFAISRYDENRTESRLNIVKHLGGNGTIDWKIESNQEVYQRWKEIKKQNKNEQQCCIIT